MCHMFWLHSASEDFHCSESMVRRTSLGRLLNIILSSLLLSLLIIIDLTSGDKWVLDLITNVPCDSLDENVAGLSRPQVFLTFLSRLSRPKVFSLLFLRPTNVTFCIFEPQG